LPFFGIDVSSITNTASLLSEGLSLLFGLSLVLWKRHPFADDFSARLVFRLHVKILWSQRLSTAA
jgi:hypothetical protein